MLFEGDCVASSGRGRSVMRSQLGISRGLALLQLESQRSRGRLMTALLTGPARNAPPTKNRYAARIVCLQIFRLALADVSTGAISRPGIVDGNVKSSILMVRKPAAARHGIRAAVAKYVQRASLDGLIRTSDNQMPRQPCSHPGASKASCHPSLPDATNDGTTDAYFGSAPCSENARRVVTTWPISKSGRLKPAVSRMYSISGSRQCCRRYTVRSASIT